MSEAQTKPQPPRQTSAQQLGQRGEDLAAAHMTRAGFKVLARNWRHGRLELDMVCEEGHTVVFVEVKTRKAGGLTEPAEALTPRKMNALARAARHWLQAHDAWERPCRFDLVAVWDDGKNLTLEHYRHAFDFTAALGGGHTTWQPW